MIRDIMPDRPLLRAGAVAMCVFWAAPNPAIAQVPDVEKNYIGQTIQFVVGAAADSSYMQYARFIGRHMVKYNSPCLSKVCRVPAVAKRPSGCTILRRKMV
ncbi:MAG: hypothetical protein ACPGPC_10635 [Alphaproteobacteria bacterium]